MTLSQTCPTISIEFATEAAQPNRFRRLLKITVEGRYRDGAKGNPDAALIATSIQMADRIWNPRAIVIDLSRLDYRWGDEFEYLYDACRKYAIVVGPDCRRAMSTLEFGIDTDRDITELEEVFDNIDDAVAYLNK